MEINNIPAQMSTEEKAALCSGLDYWHTKPNGKYNIPSLMMCDGPHGLRKQTEETDHLGMYGSKTAVCFPCAAALAASFDRNLLSSLGDTLGKVCRSEGVGMLLGPGINIKRTPLCGRNFEYFSEDPYLTGELAASYVKALQANRVSACVKHFACNNQETDRMTINSNVGKRALNEIYLSAFERVVKTADPHAIMCAYNSLNGEFCSENKELITDILREKWGFGGLTVTDWGAVKNRVRGLEAGLDLEMPGGKGAQDHKIVEAVENGSLDIEILNKTAQRILKFVSEHVTEKCAESDHSAEHIKSIEYAKECIVLLQNKNSLLPLSRGQRIAFIGQYAKSPRYQGAGSSKVNSFYVENSHDSAKRRGVEITFSAGYEESGEDNRDLLLEAVNNARNSDVAVIFIGLPDRCESEGYDRNTLELPENQNELIAQIAQVQPNTVVVIHAGAPVLMPWKDEVSSILLAYLGGEGVGEAVVSVLVGETNPSGKLAETFPLRIEDTPAYTEFPCENGDSVYRDDIFVGYRYYDKRNMNVLFPFGHGLSYTQFAYSDLTLSKKSIGEDDVLEVSCNITNIGPIKGKEAVQLYVEAKNSKIRRAVRELKGFEKIELLPNQTKTVCFELDSRAFSYFDERKNDWCIESGEYIIEIGSSSRCIKIADSVEVIAEEVFRDFTLLTPIGLVMKNSIGAEFIKQIIIKTKNLSLNETGTDVAESDKGVFNAVAETLVGIPLCSLISYGASNEDELLVLIEKMRNSR